MNWVGGVRRRVLLREEEQRCQDQYFAAHASSARQHSRILQGQRNTSLGYTGCPGESTQQQHPVEPRHSRLRIGSHHHRNEEMVCERIKRNSAFTAHTFQKQHNVTGTKYPAEIGCRRKTGRSQVDVRLDDKNNGRTSRAHLIKLASIHGPFSEFLLKLEMQGIEKKLSHEQLHRSSEGRLPWNSHVGERVEEQTGERDKMPARSDGNIHKDRKGRIQDNATEDKITKWNRKKDEKSINKYRSSSERKTPRKEKGKEEETTDTQSRSKKDKNKLQRTDRDKNVDELCGTKLDRSKNEESIYKDENRRNITNEKSMKQSDNLKGETSSYKNRDEKLNRQGIMGNDLKKGACKTCNFPELKCNKRKNVTDKTEDNIKSQELLHSGMKYQKHTVNGKNKKGDAKEQHSDRHKKEENNKMHESSRQSLTDTNNTASDFYEPKVVSLTIMKDKMSTKENMYLGGKKAEKKKTEQNTRVKRTHVVSGGSTASSTSKQSTIGRNRTSNLLTGAPRLRELLTLSPERYKGRIWAPLNLAQEPSVRNKTDAIILNDGSQKNLVSSDNTIKQGKKNTHSVQGKYDENLTHHKQKCIKDSRTKKHKKNNEWEAKRLDMLFGSRLKTSPRVYSVPHSNHNYIDDIENQDTNVHRHSCNISKETLLRNSLKEGKNDFTTRYFETNMDDNLVHSIQGVEESNNEKARFDNTGLGLRKLGERKLEVIHENNDKIDEKTVQMWQTSGKNKPKLSIFTRKLVQVDSGLKFAQKRKDKTPYLDKSFMSPWNLNTFINTPSSCKSSKTPSDPTLERLLEDTSGSQEGLELHNISDHSPDFSQGFESHDMPENNNSTIQKSISQTSENESYSKEFGLSLNSIANQLQISRANLDNEKDCIFSGTSDDNTGISKIHQIFEDSYLTTDHKIDKIPTCVQDISQVSTSYYARCFRNSTNSFTNSLQNSINSTDKSLYMKQNGEIKTKLNSNESKNSLSETSVQVKDIHDILWKDESLPLTTTCEIPSNNNFRFNVSSTEKDTPDIPITEGEIPCTYASDIHPVQVISRDVLESLDSWTPRLQMQINRSAIPQNLNLKIHHPWALTLGNTSSCTFVNEVNGSQTLVDEVIPTYDLGNGTQKLLIHDIERGSSCTPCKEVPGLQVSHTEISDRSDITFLSEMSYEQQSYGLTSQLLSAQDSLQPTYECGDFPQLMHTVSHTPPTNISSTVSQEYLEEMSKFSLPHEGMQDFPWLDSSEKRELEYVTPTAGKAEVNIIDTLCHNSVDHSYKKSISVELQDHQITRREPFSNLDMPLIHNQSIVNSENNLTEKVVGDPSDLEENMYIKGRNTYSVFGTEENAKCNKGGTKANCKVLLELDKYKITRNSGSKSDSYENTGCTECPTSDPVSKMTNLQENCSVGEESTQKLNSRDEVQVQYQGNRKDKGEAVCGVRDVSGGQEETEERRAKDGGENLSGTNQEAYDTTPAECRQGEIKQYDNLTVDMAGGDANQAVNRETDSHSQSSSGHIFRSTLEEELLCSSEVEEERREHWIVNPELAAQQFREVMGLTDDEPSEEFKDGIPYDLQLRS